MTPPYVRMIAPLPRPEDARPFDAAAFERDLRRLRDELAETAPESRQDAPQGHGPRKPYKVAGYARVRRKGATVTVTTVRPYMRRRPTVPQTGVGGTVPPVPIDATAPVGPTVPDAVSDALSEKRCADG